MDNYISLVGYILLASLVVGLFTFVIMYVVGSDWRQTAVGRYLLYFMLTVAVAFAYILLYPLIRAFPGKVYMDVTILLFLNFGAWKLTWLLRKIQKGNYKDERDSEKNIR